MPIDLDALAALAPRPTAPARPLADVVAPPGVAPGPGQVGAAASRNAAGAVKHATPKASDLDRILAIPRRQSFADLDPVEAERLADEWTDRLRRHRAPGSCACRIAHGRACLDRLKPAQAFALREASERHGLIGLIGVGHGKTLIDFLVAMVVPDASPIALLIPPGLRGQLVADYRAASEHFRVPSLVHDGGSLIVPGAPVVHVVPYSRFSRPESTDFLRRLAPKMIVLDEAHKARHRDTATTRRLLRYFREAPGTKLCAWSGSLAGRSIKDFAHLALLALREGSPLPLDPDEVDAWATTIDPVLWPAPPGDLLQLCEPGEHVRDGFHRRLVSTPGVVATRGGACDASIYLHDRKIASIPAEVDAKLEELRLTWVRPDGEELIDALAVNACARQLAAGFFYRWKFPRGEARELIEEWLEARKLWHRELRDRLRHPVEHLDSPKLATNAAERGTGTPRRAVGSTWWESRDGHRLPFWNAENFSRWHHVKDLVRPETEAVWIDDFLARDAAAWAQSHRGIVWYDHAAFGHRVAEISGLELHAGGPGAEARILATDGSRSIIASITAHGTGRDGLQRIYHEQLVAEPPSGGDAWEQLLGRLHRIGQEADEVLTWVPRHTEEFADAIDRAVRLAKFVEGVTGSNQKLLASTCDWDLLKSAGVDEDD